MTGRWFFMLLGLFGGIAPALVYWYGGRQVISGNLSAGEVVAFAALVTRIFTPVTQLLSVWITVQSSLALFERVFDYGDLPVEIADAPDAIDLPSVQGRVTYDHVSFSYGRTAPALDDVSFEVEPGQVAALVGTVRRRQDDAHVPAAAPLRRHLRPRAHRRPRRAQRSPARRSTAPIGVVTQEPYLFHAIDPREHPLRAAGRHRRRDPGRRPGRLHRRVRRRPPVRLRHHRRRARLPAVRRREAARRHRPRRAEGPADPHPRRGHVVARLTLGARHPARAR